MAPRTILVADDDPVTLRVIAGRLQQEGFHILTAADAMQAVMIAHRRSPDLILIDVQMPGGTGLDALQRLRMSSKTNRIPAIAISASPDRGLPERAHTTGAAAFLPKPLDFPALLKQIRRILGLPAPPPSQE